MKKLFITTASWEPRFLLGAKRVREEHNFDTILCFNLIGPNNRNQNSIDQLKEAFQRVSKILTPEVQFHPQSQTNSELPVRTAWIKIFECIQQLANDHDSFVFDITTTPREVLWITLDLLNEFHLSGKIVYHRAQSHSDWCSSDPRAPHIVPKLGGVTDLDSPTKLAILTGFDPDRCEHFISFFEPEETLIILQRGSDEEDEEKNQIPHKKRFDNHTNVKWKSLNSYSDDWGLSELSTMLPEFAQGANLVMASIGPKTSSVALYRIHRNISNSMLVYSNCRSYNKDYSFGIGETLVLDWKSNNFVTV